MIDEIYLVVENYTSKIVWAYATMLEAQRKIKTFKIKKHKIIKYIDTEKITMTCSEVMNLKKHIVDNDFDEDDLINIYLFINKKWM